MADCTASGLEINSLVPPEETTPGISLLWIVFDLEFQLFKFCRVIAVGIEFGEALASIDIHGAEFDELELLSSFTESVLKENRWSRSTYLDVETNANHDRKEEDEGNRCDDFFNDDLEDYIFLIFGNRR